MRRMITVALAVFGAVMCASGSDGGDVAAVFAFQNTWSPTDYGNDCANFVSKSLLAGGWSITGHPWSDQQDNSLWFQYLLADRHGLKWRRSRSWTEADNFEKHLIITGLGVRTYNTAELKPGDVVIADWGLGDWNNPDQAIADGHGHHVMIVHQNLGYGDVICCQHSNPHMWRLNVLRNHFPRAAFRMYHTFGHSALDGLIEGQMYRESSHAEVYVAINKGLLWLTTLDDVMAWGGWVAINVVPNGTLHPTYGGNLPLEGTMVRERNHPEVWLIRSGCKCWVSTEYQVDHFGTWDAVRIIPNGSMGFFQRGPDVTEHP